MRGLSVRARQANGQTVLSVHTVPACLLRVTVDPASLPALPYDRHVAMTDAIRAAIADQNRGTPEQAADLDEHAAWINRLAGEMGRKLIARPAAPDERRGSR